jgi:DNA-binding response OmpR family regulator
MGPYQNEGPGIACYFFRGRGDMANILVVDDEKQIRLMLRRMLEREGHKVTEAPDGKIALKSHRENPADLVITDIIMPEMEGIKAISGGGKNDPEQYLQFAKKLGADRTFTKPFERDALLKAVNEFLN